MEFRLLTADEIECRVGAVGKSNNGFSLLLYKDARTDMTLLDETVGAMNWQKRYTRDNANCTIEIWDDDKKQWVSKEDTGTESNTEKEKGLASDSFKRAGFNWGIGRELYTAPFIWVTDGDPKYDRFKVTHITYKDRKIDELVIANSKTGEIVFDNTSKKPKSSATSKKTKEQNDDATEHVDEYRKALKGLLNDLKKMGAYDEFWEEVKTMFSIESVDDLDANGVVEVGKLTRKRVIEEAKRKEKQGE